MKKSPHRFLLFMCSRCSCSFSPCRRLHVLKAGSNWIESVCGKVPIRFSKPTPWVFLHVKQRPQSWEPAFTRVVWPHSQRTPRHKGHEIQNGRTHCPSLLHHGASAKTVQACCPLCTCPPSSTALYSSPAVFSFSPYPSLFSPLLHVHAPKM